ncbi:Beta-glucoside kinase [Paraliobacillus sp. PM-2]|uniref:ROK family protein n=1 Tax=Paraliobacillus sp. PM-2 TaxID=1462524 RepID=UPI00061C04E1|nr:ROK family protein [Paraliobacillus sp. PM-2]CQR47140.1 Beta-glucoside kinase [Paraliobacillus sp. PM-2]
MKYAIGIDIGGTKIASGIVNEKGDLIQSEVVESDPSDREKMFERVISCVNQLMNHCSIPTQEIYGIGVGVPGKVDIENGIAVFQNNLPWTNFPLVDRLREALQIENIVIDNDVYMAAYAEWAEAKVSEEELFAYITISTGISSSFIKGGKFIRGAGFAGELGLVPTYAPGHEKPVERLELVAAGPALQKKARKVFDNEELSPKDVFAKYENGNAVARDLIDDMVSSFAHGIYMINSLLDPHKIVLGGSIATKNPALLGIIKEKLDTHLIDEQKHILDEIHISHLGSDQGIIGAGLRPFRMIND